MPLTIPTRGYDPDDTVDKLMAMRRDDPDWRGGRMFGLVYELGEAHQRVLSRVRGVFGSSHAPNPFAFRSLHRIEAEVVRMSANLMRGNHEVVGTMTGSGAESILLALRSAKKRARAMKPKLVNPNMVVPETVHASFDKAANYLGVEIRYARVDSSWRADVADMNSLIDASTVLLAASAPQYAQGVIDPVEHIAELARKRKLPLHVDASLGGYLLPWLERLGHPVMPWDFRVDGVTSIGADLDHFGFADPGASVLLYRDMSHLRHQFFVSNDWSGGIYLSPGMSGTRPASAIATAWASLVSLGEQGFLDHSRKALDATKRLIAGVQAISDLEIVGQPDSTTVSWRTKPEAKLAVYRVADELEDRGWSVARQQNPDSVHCTLTSQHADVIGEYIEDLRAAVRGARASRETMPGDDVAVYGMLQRAPYRPLLHRTTIELAERLYGPDAASPSLDAIIDFDEDDGMMMRLLKRYGGRALGFLDKIEVPRPRRR